MLRGPKSIGHGLLLTGSVPPHLICEQIIEYRKVLFPAKNSPRFESPLLKEHPDTFARDSTDTSLPQTTLHLTGNHNSVCCLSGFELLVMRILVTEVA